MGHRTSRHGGALLVVLLGLMTAFGPLSLDMYLPAFPEIGADLGVPPAQVQLSLTTCLLGLAAGQLIFGPVSDRLGRRPLAILGMTAYAVASTAIALAPSAPTLIGLRFVQGLAGAARVGSATCSPPHGPCSRTGSSSATPSLRACRWPRCSPTSPGPRSFSRTGTA